MDRYPHYSNESDGDSEWPAGRSRDSLFLMARFRSAALREDVDVRVRNLSEGGLMAEIATPLDVDTPVEIEVRGIGWVAGRIAWYAEGRAGVAFDSPIDPQRARKPVGQGTKTPEFAKPVMYGR